MNNLLFKDLTSKLFLTIYGQQLLNRITPSHAEYSVKVREVSNWDPLCKLYTSAQEISVHPFLQSTEMLEMQCIKICCDYNGCMAVSLNQNKCLLCSTSHGSNFEEMTTQITGLLHIYQLLLREVDFFYPHTENCIGENVDPQTHHNYFNHENEPFPVSMIKFCKDTTNYTNEKGSLAGMKTYYGNNHEGYQLGCLRAHDCEAWPPLWLDSVEFILQIDMNRDSLRIRGLTVHTNKKSYGLYGVADGHENSSMKGYRLRYFQGITNFYILKLTAQFERC